MRISLQQISSLRISLLRISLLQISLLRILLMRFFKKIYKFALCEFMPYTFGYLISLVQFFAQFG